MRYQTQSSPDKDTGWGLIFRLNDLWNDIEGLCPAGKYEDWNFKLDRIYSNLLYREKLIIDEKDGEIISIKLVDKDAKTKNFLDKKIKAAKRKIRLSKRGSKVNRTLYLEGKDELYKSILLKEIWLRKFMHELGLYIKETKHNPAGAMWGK